MTVIIHPTHRADQVVFIPLTLMNRVPGNDTLPRRFSPDTGAPNDPCYAGVPRQLGWSRCRNGAISPRYVPHSPGASEPATLRHLCQIHAQADHLVIPAPGQERGWGA
jgi:hypothetical protein